MDHSMIRLSIKRKIIGIAVALIVLMTITALISTALVVQVGGRLQELTQSYFPAYGALARANVHTLERALVLQRMVIEKIAPSLTGEQFEPLRKSFVANGEAVEKELKAARTLIDGLIENGSRFADTTALVRLQTRISDVVDDTRAHLDDEIARLLPLLDSADHKAIAESLERVDALRDEVNLQINTVRAEWR
jgi:polyhydroxyalkanoate synthesis regulator phasin